MGLRAALALSMVQASRSHQGPRPASTRPAPHLTHRVDGNYWRSFREAVTLKNFTPGQCLPAVGCISRHRHAPRRTKFKMIKVKIKWSSCFYIYLCCVNSGKTKAGASSSSSKRSISVDFVLVLSIHFSILFYFSCDCVALFLHSTVWWCSA